MNKRKVTKCKGSKLKANNGPSEVFVLPPNLLEALGINLGNIETAPECTSGNQVSEKDLIFKEKSGSQGSPSNISENTLTMSSEKKISVTKTAEKDLIFKEKDTSQGTPINTLESNFTTSSEKESSIIQTANLMTASVLLSPTFLSNNRSIIEGEIEIVGNAEAEAISKPNVYLKNNEYNKNYQIIQAVIPNQNQDPSSVCNLENPSDAQSSETIQEINKDVQSTDVHVEINNVVKGINCDDHADEAYSSDGSNGNVEMIDKSDGSNCSVLLATNNSKKISIISEQILDPSQFKPFQSNNSHKTKCLIPVGRNALLKSNRCYQSGLNHDFESKLGSYYVAPSESADPDLCDLNEQNSVCEYVTPDPNQALKENDYMNQNAETCNGSDNYIKHNMMSNVSEEIVMDIEMQEGPSQYDFKEYKNEFYTHLFLPDTFNVEDRGNSIMEKNTLDTTNTNMTNYEEEKVNKSLQTVDSTTLDIRNIQVNGNFLSSVSEDNAVSTQMQVDLSQHGVDLRKSNFDNQLVPDDTFNRGWSDETMETNITNQKNANTITTKFQEERENETFQKVLHEQNFYDNCNTSSSLSEYISISTTQQEGSSQHVFEVYKSEFDTHLLLPAAVTGVDNCNIMETNKSITIEEKKIYETLQKDNLNALDEQNLYVDNKQQERSTDEAPDKIISKPTTINENHRKASHDANSKIKSNILSVKDSKIINRDRKDHLSQNAKSSRKRSETNVKKQKSKDKVKHIQVMKKVLKHTRNKNTDPEINEMLVDAEAKSTLQSAEELHECSVPDSKTEIIQCSNKFLSTSETEAKSTLQSAEELHECSVPDSKTEIIQCSNKFLSTSETMTTANDQEDKIREIAGYLSKYAELQKRRKISKEKQYIRSKESSNKKHATNTKLSIQGVEKPGGKEKSKHRRNDKNIKTYERIKKNKPSFKELSTTLSFVTFTQNINLSDNNLPNTCHDADLCLCDDFGRLKCYDEQNVYEHIHFWNRKRVDCTTELTFSIYNENVSAEMNTDESVEGTSNLQDHSHTPIQFSSTPDHKVCWNEINFIDIQGFDKEDSEHNVISSHENIETGLLTIGKSNESSVDELMKPDPSKCSTSQAKNLENLHKKSKVTENLLENCQMINNNIVPDVNPMKNKKKRKYSSTFNGIDKLPATQHVSNRQLPACAKSDKIVKKQKCSNNDRTEKTTSGDQPDSEGNFAVSQNKVTSAFCAVCRQDIEDTDWLKHIALQHNYLAWRVDEEPLDLKNRQVLLQHLSTLIKQHGKLTCHKCGTTRKYAKPFLQHINQCTTVEEFQIKSVLTSSSDFGSKGDPVNHSSSSIDLVGVTQEPDPVRLVECGVCGESVQDKDWNSHIGSQHNYLARKLGEQTLDIDDEDEVKQHLYIITKECGGLKCAKCGLTRKYVKSYLTHIKRCDGQSVSETLNESTPNCSVLNISEVEPVRSVSDPPNNISVENGAELVTDDLVKCGVCEEFTHSKGWITHIRSQHNYLAWKHGESTLDIDDEVAVKEHLYNIMKECGGLQCVKCGLTRKYVKSYLTHIRNCDGLSESIGDCEINASLDVSEIEQAQHVSDLVGNISIENELDATSDGIQCAVCGESMHANDWYEHMGLKHHYIAWRCGDPALDFNDEEATHTHLYAITKQYGGLKCVKCGVNRKYVKSYLTHVKSCTGPKVSSEDDNPIADNSTPNIVVLSEAEQHTGLTKCGVCGQYMPLTQWNAHLEDKHNYFAWKDDEPPLNVNDEEELRDHLKTVIKEMGRLVCRKCGLQRRVARLYLQHIEKCNGFEETGNSSKVTDEVIWPSAGAGQVKCGVCGELIQASLWIKHIAEQHDYMANKVGETALDVDNEEEVFKHLYNIVQQNGSLTCQKCGTERKYVKSYLEHIRKCGQNLSVTVDTTFETNTSLDASEYLIDFNSGGICGVCEKEVDTGKWIQHIQKEHNYLAWRQGEKPWELENFTEVNEYLYEISKRMGGLTCNKCGLVRKYVKSYLTHIKSCTVVDFNLAAIAPEGEGVGPVSDKAYRCAMCQKEIEPSNWKDHAIKEHYNITWIIGETPIDIKNPYAVEKYLKEYKQYHSLKCNNCGATRASFAGFYAHIITCGKTEEQIEMFQSVCDICKNKYLCIYKNQHMMIHRVQEHSKELKMAKENRVEKEESVTSGKRQAAQKARSVIETYSSDMSQHKHKCSTCGFGTDYEEELQTHRCDQNEKDFSEEESSAAEGECSEDESGDSDVDSSVSREEELATHKRMRYKEPVSGGSKLSKIYFKVDNPDTFVEQSDIDFCKAYYTDDTLFTKWLYCNREVVSENDLPKYLPPMEESCKVRAGFDWTKLKRFKAKTGDGTCIFIGGCIVCITWIPPRVEDIMGDGQNFLAVACHNDVDCPRYQWDETPQHENLIQIWDFGNCKELPRIVYGIAHDFGTVWSMDWCPSGARSVLQEDVADDQFCRLGLLAVACSNGSAYIFSVPHPSTVVKDNQFIHKLRPVAELRMKMLGERSHRNVYQATSVTWSKQKGHDIILVGYADGSTGYFDVNSTSPLARRIEDNIEIFFPYSQERPHNTCITATDMYPRLWGGFVSCSASATGAAMAAPRSAVRVRSALPARAAAFAPHWPAALLAGDVAIMNTAVNELEWTAPARKLGGVRALAGCARCGRVAAAAPPALRVMRPHPAYPEFRKPIFGLIEMISLAKKRTKQVNDELGMKIEPLTYHEAINKYGIEFQSVSTRDKALQQKCAGKPKVHFPERFPLADVESMAFCPTKRHHDRLAVATHSGILFFTNVDS